MKANYTDLMTKIVDPGTFTHLCDGIFASKAIPDLQVGQGGTSGASAKDDGDAPSAAVTLDGSPSS